MQSEWLQRTELLIKEEGIERLQSANILIVGLGGVGSFAAEFLVRSGIGNLTIVDGDTVDITNINRQLPALNSTIGKNKTDVVAERILDINPEINLKKINEFLEPERMEEILTQEKFDYVLDCIDSLSPKLAIISTCKRKKIKLVSAMGAGGKTDPSKVMVRGISARLTTFFWRNKSEKNSKKNKYTKDFAVYFPPKFKMKTA